jgi:glutathione S-transferase
MGAAARARGSSARSVDAHGRRVDHRLRVRPTLYGTPRSHFTRIVRILCHELSLDVDWVDVGNVGVAQAFGGNPLMQVPVLVDGEHAVWDSHDICRYLVERQGADPLGIESLDWAGRSLVSVVQGVMIAAVRLVLAERCGMETTGPFFDKARETIRRGLEWIDERIESQVGLTYPAVCAVAMWDHLLLYRHAEQADAPRIDRVVQRLGEHASIARTRPS